MEDVTEIVQFISPYLTTSIPILLAIIIWFSREKLTDIKSKNEETIKKIDSLDDAIVKTEKNLTAMITKVQTGQLEQSAQFSKVKSDVMIIATRMEAKNNETMYKLNSSQTEIDKKIQLHGKVILKLIDKLKKI
jgi:ribosomal protein L29